DADALIRAYLPSPQLHRAGGAATIVHQRAVDAQYLVVRLPQQIGILPQQLLNLGFTGQEVGDDAYRRSYGAYLAHGPVAQQAGYLLIIQREAFHLLLHQGAGQVMLRVGAGASLAQQVAYQCLELRRQGRQRLAVLAVLAQGGAIVARCPALQRLLQARWPAHEGALDAQGEGLGEAGDEFGPGLVQRTQRQVLGDLPTYRLEGRHARGAE